MQELSLYFKISSSEGPIKGKVIEVFMGKAISDQKGASQGRVIARSIPQKENLEDPLIIIALMKRQIEFYLMQREREDSTVSIENGTTHIVLDSNNAPENFRVNVKIKISLPHRPLGKNSSAAL